MSPQNIIVTFFLQKILLPKLLYFPGCGWEIRLKSGKNTVFMGALCKYLENEKYRILSQNSVVFWKNGVVDGVVDGVVKKRIKRGKRYKEM